MKKYGFSAVWWLLLKKKCRLNNIKKKTHAKNNVDIILNLKVLKFLHSYNLVAKPF